MANKDYKKEKQKALDDLILSAYKLGWCDCFGGDVLNKTLFKRESVLEIAFEIGWADYIAGDDVTSVDCQTDTQILKNIKSIHKRFLDNKGREGSYDK